KKKKRIVSFLQGKKRNRNEFYLSSYQYILLCVFKRYKMGEKKKIHKWKKKNEVIKKRNGIINKKKGKKKKCNNKKEKKKVIEKEKKKKKIVGKK
ncbi:hypothetical protein RFI_36495, partial [Reticulomyxa filosa]